jgi:hypothetical protein
MMEAPFERPGQTARRRQPTAREVELEAEGFNALYAAVNSG